ncbi:MAG: pantetheine-phosphate adenylyltransferase [Candidatus Promineifilaceae bacterium]
MNIRAIYPGTFDPVHYGHLDLMYRAAAIFDTLVVGVFDHGRPSKSVLFSVEERVNMIHEALDDKPKNILIRPFSGLLVDFADQVGAKVIVRGLRVFSDFEFEFRMALANQRLKPGIEMLSFMTREEHSFLSSTIIREIASFQGDISSMVPPNVQKTLLERFNGDNADGYTVPVSLRD